MSDFNSMKEKEVYRLVSHHNLDIEPYEFEAEVLQVYNDTIALRNLQDDTRYDVSKFNFPFRIIKRIK